MDSRAFLQNESASEHAETKLTRFSERLTSVIPDCASVGTVLSLKMTFPEEETAGFLMMGCLTGSNPIQPYILKESESSITLRVVCFGEGMLFRMFSTQR
jgi:hypothetical protein